jgi:protein-tyrosine phosphatase
VNPKLYWLKNASSGLAISARPRGGDWLEDEVEGWRRQGIDVVVSLLTDHEKQELDLINEDAIAVRKGIQYFSFPIEDRGVPSSLSETENIALQLAAEVQEGKKVVIHCRQGIGRSSLLAAAVLISSGEDIASALKVISDARGVEVPETPEQRDWLKHFAKTRSASALR